MNTSPLLLAIIGHLVGDYLLQNDWMALHKKQSTFRCAIHCTLWSLSVMGFSGWSSPTWHSFVIYTVLFWTHFAQDRTNIVAWWMDLIGQHQFRTGGCAPWSTIVVDNVWHIVALWMIWRFIA